MTHRAFYPTRAQVEEGKQPQTEFHDVLVVPPLRQTGGKVLEDENFFRFGVVKTDDNDPSRPGKYVDAPEIWGKADVGQRKVVGIAYPAQVKSGVAEERGPVFAALPIKAEPGASSCAFCYLVDARNLVSPNAWTAEEWDAPRTPDLGPAPGADAKQVEMLLALPRGIVLRFKASGLDSLDNVAAPKTATASEDGVQYEIEPVQLKREPEIWNQLRNGTIAGRALYRALQTASATPRVLPLVNITALSPQGNAS